MFGAHVWDELQQAQGWSTGSMNMFMENFIDDQELVDKFMVYLQKQVDEENGECNGER